MLGHHIVGIVTLAGADHRNQVAASAEEMQQGAENTVELPVSSGACVELGCVGENAPQ